MRGIFFLKRFFIYFTKSFQTIGTEKSLYINNLKRRGKKKAFYFLSVLLLMTEIKMNGSFWSWGLGLGNLFPIKFINKTADLAGLPASDLLLFNGDPQGRNEIINLPTVQLSLWRKQSTILNPSLIPFLSCRQSFF